MTTPNVYLSSDAAGTVPITTVALFQDKLGAIGPHHAKVYLQFTYEPGATYKADSDPGVDPVLLSFVDLMEPWEADTPYMVGDFCMPTADDHYYECVSPGTSDSAEPTWPMDGSQEADGTVVWEDKGPRQDVTALKLASTEAGLATAVAGDPLNCGTMLQHGAAYAVTVWIEWDDTTGALGVYPTMTLETNVLRLVAL